jgi:uncharacterized coiled-coil protein SlyX
MSVTSRARWIVDGGPRTEARLAGHDAALAQAADEIEELRATVAAQERSIADLTAEVQALRGHLRTVTEDLTARVAALHARH